MLVTCLINTPGHESLELTEEYRMEEQKQSQEADDDQQEQFTSTEPMQ